MEQNSKSRERHGSLKVGLIGCGSVARSHLAAYQIHGASVVALADSSPQSLSTMAEEVQHAAAYSSCQEMLNREALDAVSICTPPNLHREMVTAALEAGVHVLCEKPIAATLADAKAIEAVAETAKGKLMVGFRHRFMAIHQLLHRRLERGDLGKIILFRNSFGGAVREMQGKWFCRKAIAGGGVLVDTSIHSVDLFRFYCGEVDSSVAQVNRAFEGTDVEDSGVLAVRSVSGALGVLVSSWNIGVDMGDIEIHTEKAAITYTYGVGNPIIIRHAGRDELERIDVPVTNGFNEQVAYFLKAIASGECLSPSAYDGRRATEMIENAYRSV